MGERILIVDDGPGLAGLLEDALRPDDVEVTVVEHSAAARDAVKSLHPDLVVLDVPMNGLAGFAICSELRAEVAGLGIIVVSERADPRDRVAGLTAGADDYLTRPFEPEELVARVRSALRRGRGLRRHSPLTGLPGPFDVDHELSALVGQPGAGFALLLADLDHFKAFNDRYGYARGDEAIAATASLLSAQLDQVTSTPSFLGHLGGDDFAVIVEPAAVAELGDAIVGGFDQLAGELHDPADVRNGFIECETRLGTVTRGPLLSISIGVASNFLRPLLSAAQATTIAAEMRQVAKSVPGSAWRVDRRRS